jgi:hypothetical protein
VTGEALARCEHRPVEGTIEAARARRAVCHIHQTRRGGVRAGRTLHRSVAAERAIVARRADVVDRGVDTLHARLADVADLEPGLAALMRCRHGAAATAEEALAALAGGLREASRAAVVARRALGALADVLEAVAIAVGAVGAEELGVEARSLGAVAAGWAIFRGRRLVEAIRASRTNLTERKFGPRVRNCDYM